MISAGFLVLAASLFLPSGICPLLAQFPIRQVPQGGRGQGPSVSSQGPGASGQWPAARNPAAAAGSDSRSQGLGVWPAATVRTPPLPAVARITVVEKDGISFGSGTLIDARGEFGLVVSNWHVVRDAAGPITVEFPDGFKSPAEVVKTDKDWDLAALSIYRPRATPLPITAAAPQPGEPLTIAGYGSGDWRMASGRCTQYLAPGVEFPHEMIELAAQARQGDSGGPILNQRGEVAGVLFGSGPGYTSGSYGGRVLQFLSTVIPAGGPGNDRSLAGGGDSRGAAAASPDHAAQAPPPAPPLSTSLHENQPPLSSPPSGQYVDQAAPPPAAELAALTPAHRPTNDPLLSPPPPRETAERFGAPARAAGDDVDPRAAVTPGPADLTTSPLVTTSVSALDRPTAPRTDATAPVVDLHQAPAGQLLAAVWKQFGGATLFDQTKAVLAIIGALSLVVVFLRFGSHKEREHEEE